MAQSKTILIITAKILFIFAAFYLIFTKIDFQEFVEHLESCNPFYLFLAYIMLQLSLLFSALRSRYYFSTFGLKLTRTFAIKLYYIGMLFNVILPGGISGDGYKVFVLSKLENFSKIKSLRIMLYERVNGFHALVALGFIFGFFTTIVYQIPYGIPLSIFGLVMLTPTYLWGVKYVLKDSIRTALDATFYSITVQVFQVISAAFVVKALLPDSSAIVYCDLIFLFIVASIFAIIPISIGGVGIRELTMLYGLEFITYPLAKEAGVAFAGICFILYFFTSIIGLPLMYKLNKVKRLTKREIKIW